MSEGKEAIRDDGIGSGLSIWMDDGVISLNGRLRVEETFRGKSCEFLWGHTEFEMPVRCQVEVSSRESDIQTQCSETESGRRSTFGSNHLEKLGASSQADRQTEKNRDVHVLPCSLS